jgi:hypothetical protein
MKYKRLAHQAVFVPPEFKWTRDSSWQVTACKGFVYVIGGKQNSVQTNTTCERFDIVNDTWEEIASLPQSAFSMSVLLQNRCLYVFGGSSS